MLPPSALAARRASSRETSRISRCRPSDGLGPAAGEWWWSVTVSWRATERPVSTAPTPNSAELGRVAGGVQAAMPTVRLAIPTVRRRPWATVSVVEAQSEPSPAGLGGGWRPRGPSATLRVTSMNCSDRRIPPSPSVIVWCIFCTSAARPSGRPSTITNSHSGRVRSSGSCTNGGGQVEQLAQRAGLGQGEVAHVPVDVEVGGVAPLRRAPAGRGPGTTRWCRRGMRDDGHAASAGGSASGRASGRAA